jgi:hypothetical protein
MNLIFFQDKYNQSNKGEQSIYKRVRTLRKLDLIGEIIMKI